MGFMTEGQVLAQAKKGQGETNARLDAVLAELKRQNELLERLVVTLTPTVQPVH